MLIRSLDLGGDQLTVLRAWAVHWVEAAAMDGTEAPRELLVPCLLCCMRPGSATA